MTEIDDINSPHPKLRYIGISDHPRLIEVSVTSGSIFTIGRFDISVGIKQSNFEFDKKTKAVSRRHSAIERNADGYSIVDLESAGGTFLNGQKLPPNAPFKLERGARVSFGNLGADYVWEE
jgi:pSer/pThr/pTyr-binding forkhead associated (FHA) protein